MEQETAAPVGDGQIPLNESSFGAFALMEIHDNPPAIAWERMSVDARRQWLAFARSGQGWSAHAWTAVHPTVQRDLRRVMRQIMVFLAQAGADFFGNR